MEIQPKNSEDVNQQVRERSPPQTIVGALGAAGIEELGMATASSEADLDQIYVVDIDEKHYSHGQIFRRGGAPVAGDAAAVGRVIRQKLRERAEAAQGDSR